MQLGKTMELDEETIKFIQDMFQKQREKAEDIVKSSHEWYLLTCPHCNTTFKVTFNGSSLHCYDYLTDKCESIVVSIATGMAECPVCRYNLTDKDMRNMIWVK